MTRNFRIFGLALMAAFALCAVVASAASAQKLTSDGPVTLTGTENRAVGSGPNGLTAFGNKVECPESTYTGHKTLTLKETEEGKKHALLASGESTVTITPHYKQTNHNCKVTTSLGTTLIATVDMNGCDYVLHLGATTGGVAHTYGVTSDVVCPTGKVIQITVFTTTTTHTEGKLMCEQRVGTQSGKPGLHATDTTNGTIDLKGTVTGLTIVEAASASHPFVCPAKETATGEMHLDVLVKGVNSTGGATPISLSHP